MLGSEAYVRSVRQTAERYGNKAALARLMQDVDKNGSQIDRNKYEDNLRLYRLICFYVGKTGAIDMELHYFRNKLNRAPKTLSELLKQNKKLPRARRWKLLSVTGSLYHMQGPDGIYNLKFISGDGFCEGVYNKKGELLTEENDSVNMGTFNYAAGILQTDAHYKYDLDPYFSYGNTLDCRQKGYEPILYSVAQASEAMNQNIDAILSYRGEVIKRMQETPSSSVKQSQQ